LLFLWSSSVQTLYAIGFGIAGLLVGWAYFFLMRFSLLQLGKEKQRIAQFVALALLRMALFGGGVVGAALVSTWSLVTFAVGFVIARSIAVCRVKIVSDFSPSTSKSEKKNA
jgi:hydrogenase/urease accessory protein HupE